MPHLVDATVDNEVAAAPDWKWVGGWALPWTLGALQQRSQSPAIEAGITDEKEE